VRLVCPALPVSVFSLMPSAETIPAHIMMEAKPAIDSGIPVINSVVNPVLQQSFSPQAMYSANPLQIWIPVGSVVWLVGIGGMLLYMLVSYLRLCRRVRTAVRVAERVYESEQVSSPFVLGVIRPRIYLPVNAAHRSLLLAHEQAHIVRKDHWWKPLGFLLLSVYWFQPLLWVAYVLLCRDIELACDEKVIRDLDCDHRADYSQALLNCGIPRRMVSACPVAFGEVDIPTRIRAVLRYRKPAVWIVVFALVITAAAAALFLTDPVKAEEGAAAPLAIENPGVSLEAAISEAILRENSSGTEDGLICVESHKLLATEANADGGTGETKTVTAYVIAMYHAYNPYSILGRGLEVKSGTYGPVVLTFTQENGRFALLEYWMPRDGAYYTEDIRNRFPGDTAEDALREQQYVDELAKVCEDKAHRILESRETALIPGTTLSYERMVSAVATAYTHDGAGRTTATGTKAAFGTVAVDPQVIPLGSKLYITSADGSVVYGTGFAEDTQENVTGHAVDLFFETRQDCEAFGVQDVLVYILSSEP